jgi:hypothetical protein
MPYFRDSNIILQNSASHSPLSSARTGLMHLGLKIDLWNDTAIVEEDT